MKKITVAEAAEYFGVSKEAIHNRIRRGSLEVVVENGVKMVLLSPNQKAPTPKRRATKTASTSQNDERYYRLLAEQNEKLQERVTLLESETRTLRDQKERMLIEERKKIEQIYKEKDEQLKNVLNTLSKQFMLTTAPKSEDEVLEVEINETNEAEAKEHIDDVISLKKYLKKQDFSQKKIEKIREKFKKRSKKDERIIMVGKKCYINPSKYSYEDIIK